VDYIAGAAENNGCDNERSAAEVVATPRTRKIIRQ
jgi:hypothetical protein